MKKLATTLLLLSFSLNSWAFTKVVKDSYYLGHNDSKFTAEALLTEKLKLKAMDSAGTYIEAKSTLRHSRYSEEIKTISATLVKLTKMQKSYSMSNGNLVLRMEATAVIDENLLEARINQLKKDKQLQKQVRDVTVQRNILLDRIILLERQLKQEELTPMETGQLAKQIQGAKVGKLFGGSLMEFAAQKQKTEEIVTRSFRKDYKDFWTIESLSLEPTIHNVKKVKNEIHAIVKINISPEISARLRDLIFTPFEGMKIERTFLDTDRSFNTYFRFNGNSVFTHEFDGEYLQVLKAKLKYISSQPNVKLKVSINNRTTEFDFFGKMVATYFKGSWTEKPFSWSEFESHFDSGGDAYKYSSAFGFSPYDKPPTWSRSRNGDHFIKVKLKPSDLTYNDSIKAEFVY